MESLVSARTNRNDRSSTACVNGVSVVTAVEYFDPILGRPRWLLSTFGDTCAALGVTHPHPALLDNAEQARNWVDFIAAMYAKADEQITADQR